MSITSSWEWIPGWILSALNFGAEYPEGDEDAMFTLGDAWHRAAKELLALEPELREITDRTLKFYTGEGATTAHKEFGNLFAGKSSIEECAKALHDLGDYTRGGATQIEHSKILLAGFAAWTAWTVIDLAAAWPFGEAGIPFALAAGRKTIQVAAGQGLKALSEQAARQGLKNLLLPYLKKIAVLSFREGVKGAGIDAAIQTYQITVGHRDGFDPTQSLQSGFQWAAGAAVGAPISMGAGALGNRLRLGPRLNGTLAGTLGGVGGGLGMYGSGLAWQAGNQLLHGHFDPSKIDTTFDPQVVLAGGGFGALHGLGSGLERMALSRLRESGLSTDGSVDTVPKSIAPKPDAVAPAGDPSAPTDSTRAPGSHSGPPPEISAGPEAKGAGRAPETTAGAGPATHDGAGPAPAAHGEPDARAAVHAAPDAEGSSHAASDSAAAAHTTSEGGAAARTAPDGGAAAHTPSDTAHAAPDSTAAAQRPLDAGAAGRSASEAGAARTGSDAGAGPRSVPDAHTAPARSDPAARVADPQSASTESKSTDSARPVGADRSASGASEAGKQPADRIAKPAGREGASERPTVTDRPTARAADASSRDANLTAGQRDTAAVPRRSAVSDSGRPVDQSPHAPEEPRPHPTPEQRTQPEQRAGAAPRSESTPAGNDGQPHRGTASNVGEFTGNSRTGEAGLTQRELDRQAANNRSLIMPKEMTFDEDRNVFRTKDGRPISIRVAEQTLTDAVARFTERGEGYEIEVSPRARTEDVPRALAHELAEIDLARDPALSRDPSNDRPDGLTAHLAGRYAELRVLNAEIEEARADPARDRELKRLMTERRDLIDHLGLREIDAAGSQRRSLLQQHDSVVADHLGVNHNGVDFREVEQWRDRNGRNHYLRDPEGTRRNGLGRIIDSHGDYVDDPYSKKDIDVKASHTPFEEYKLSDDAELAHDYLVAKRAAAIPVRDAAIAEFNRQADGLGISKDGRKSDNIDGTIRELNSAVAAGDADLQKVQEFKQAARDKSKAIDAVKLYSEYIGMNAAQDYLAHEYPGESRILLTGRASDGRGKSDTFDIVALVRTPSGNQVVIIEAKGVGSSIGTRTVNGLKVEQGTLPYRDDLLIEDKDLRAAVEKLAASDPEKARLFREAIEAENIRYLLVRGELKRVRVAEFTMDRGQAAAVTAPTSGAPPPAPDQIRSEELDEYAAELDQLRTGEEVDQ
ncbi:hypothetical protein [Nocardia panacis]|uniref:WXG100-like domain-containing protein n=1 Tax=Nocardia panacis TaxID=2340916 RepID=UPI0013159FD8|nr:hypothetical protein [Nocardia panacis]